MADPIPNILSLSRHYSEPSRHYSVFEPDQVLTYDQLNSLADYLNDQERLTRVELLGVGIVGGLRVSLAAGKITVSRGVGVTTDGDLLLLPTDTVFASYKSYGQNAPRYAPLYTGGTMRTVYELVRDDGKNVNPKLSQFPGKLGEMVVVMLMESYQDDPDLCSGTDCDNLGKTARDTLRLLLVSRADAQSLLAAPATVATAAQALPELFASRPLLGKTLATTGALAAAYRSACANTHATLSAQLGTLHAQLPGLTGELFGGDPASAWKAKLNEHQSKAGGDLGIQYYYDFLKDVVDGWNELREALLADDSLLCPDPGAFPKHLLLGDLGDPAQARTGLYPSPLVSGNRGERDHARFLARRLQALISNFSLPATAPGAQAIRVTPSRTEAASLEERAIPYYYPAAIQQQWNFRLSRRNAAAGNLGYHLSGNGVFNRQIGRHDFFRIEGHLGQSVDSVKAALDQAIADFNLPFTLRAVLLHNDRKKIVVRPPIRYGDLHRFHHILRRELTLQLNDTKHFNASFKSEIDKAVSGGKVPDQNISSTARTRYGEIEQGITDAAPVLAQKSYGTYKQALQSKDWRISYKNVINAAGSYKGTLGGIVRTDYATAFDTLVSNNHPAWLEWLDTLIQSKDEQADNKLLFTQFCQQHPALEHFGGVTRGGTFVLIYDDQAKVVADCMLPYTWAESAENEPDEPELTLPDFKAPPLINNGFTLQPPFDWQLNLKLKEFETKLEPKWMEQINIQKDYMKFFKDSADIFGKFADGGRTVNFGSAATGYQDSMLGFFMNEIEGKKRQTEELRSIVINPATQETIRSQAQEQLKKTEQELAQALTSSSRYIVEMKVDVMAAGGDGNKALAAIAAGMDKVSDAGAIKNLQDGLKEVKAIGGGAQVQVLAVERLSKIRGL